MLGLAGRREPAHVGGEEGEGRLLVLIERADERYVLDTERGLVGIE